MQSGQDDQHTSTPRFAGSGELVSEEDRAKRSANLRRSFCLSTTEGIVAMPVVTMALPVNIYLLTLFTKGLGLSNAAIGFLTALPFVCNILQLAATPFLARWLSTKAITVAGASIVALGWIWLCVGLTSIPHNTPEAAGVWLAWWFFVLSFFGSIAGVAWSAWMQEWVPGRIRGKFFGRRNRALQLSTLAFVLITGWVLARFEYAMVAFQAIIIVAVVLRVLSIYWLWISPTPLPRDHGKLRLPLRFQVRTLLSSKSLLLFTAFGAVWSFAANCFGPFYHVFMLEQLDFSSFDVGLLSTLAALGGALSLPAWGQLLDRFGNKSVMTISLLLWQVQNFLWCVLTPDLRHLNYFMWAWGGVTSAGFVLGQFTLLLKLVPVPARNLAVGVNLAATSAAAAIAPVLGGLALDWGLNHWPSSPLSLYHVCFVLQPVVCILGVFLLLRVNEPHASSITPVVGAMRNIRTLSGIFGLGFLANYLFYRLPKR